MQHKKIVQITSESEKIDRVTCDFCGKEILWPESGVDEVIISRRVGYYGGIEITVDMCGECFDNKFTPWLHSQGVEVRTEKWEY